MQLHICCLLNDKLCMELLKNTKKELGAHQTIQSLLFQRRVAVNFDVETSQSLWIQMFFKLKQRGF